MEKYTLVFRNHLITKRHLRYRYNMLSYSEIQLIRITYAHEYEANNIIS